MRFWIWSPDDGDKPVKPTSSIHASPKSAAEEWVERHWANLDHAAETLVRVDDEDGNKFEYVVHAELTWTFTEPCPTCLNAASGSTPKAVADLRATVARLEMRLSVVSDLHEAADANATRLALAHAAALARAAEADATAHGWMTEVSKVGAELSAAIDRAVAAEAEVTKLAADLADTMQQWSASIEERDTLASALQLSEAARVEMGERITNVMRAVHARGLAEGIRQGEERAKTSGAAAAVQARAGACASEEVPGAYYDGDGEAMTNEERALIWLCGDVRPSEAVRITANEPAVRTLTALLDEAEARGRETTSASAM